ncbi:MAG: putative bifunctional diguanylate cyclase/phosphodiesterase [bacterium]
MVDQLSERLGHGPVEDRSIAVIFVRIDGFSKLCAASSEINGSVIYDEVKNHFSDLIPDTVDAFELPRLGFIYLMNDASSRAKVEEFVQQLRNATRDSFEIAGKTFNISVSIGVARGENGVTASKLLDRAQFAQHNASRQAGSTSEFYDTSRAEETRDEVALKNDLYDALDEDQFFLKYQPIVSLEDYSVCGAEALVRWDHPERGLISPGAFIPLAEKTGQILFLDRWVIHQAVNQAEAWYRTTGREIPVGINISAWQFRDNYLVEKIEELLEGTGLPPSLIKIEVTETSMMKNVGRTGEVLRSLRDLGVRVALDDFGTGHATFEYLSQFPINELKIDRSFLDFDDVYQKNQKLVDMMIETGKRVGTKILAEGVETEEQLQFVKNRGCETAQGFLFAKPIPSEELLELVRSGDSLYQLEAAE